LNGESADDSSRNVFVISKAQPRKHEVLGSWVSLTSTTEHSEHTEQESEYFLGDLGDLGG